MPYQWIFFWGSATKSGKSVGLIAQGALTLLRWLPSCVPKVISPWSFLRTLPIVGLIFYLTFSHVFLFFEKSTVKKSLCLPQRHLTEHNKKVLGFGYFTKAGAARMFGLRKKIIDHCGLFHGKVFPKERHSVPARVYPSPTNIMGT